MTFETLLYEVSDGVAVVRLNRPERMNSLGGSMKADLRAAILGLAREDDSVRIWGVVRACVRQFSV